MKRMFQQTGCIMQKNVKVNGTTVHVRTISIVKPVLKDTARLQSI